MPESRGLWRRTREKSANPVLPPRHYRKARGEFGEWLKQEIANAAEDHGLINMMRESKLLDKYSVELLLLQLEKLRKIALADGEIFITEMTRKQREILQALNLCA